MLLMIAVYVGLLFGQKVFLRNHVIVVQYTGESSVHEAVENKLRGRILHYVQCGGRSFSTEPVRTLMEMHTSAIESDISTLHDNHREISVRFGVAQWADTKSSDGKLPSGLYDSLIIQVDDSNVVECEFLLFSFPYDLPLWAGNGTVHSFIMELIGKAEIYLFQ